MSTLCHQIGGKYLNRNMVKTEDGRWVLAQRPQLADTHHEDIEPHLSQIGLISSSNK
ncbi:hypothetical protein MtrunA17_Chr7g0260691 [Medicago truncatula]|uniref:Uncharacterized protein n=1 Tax=Medicago truncatula TaxID=3880 RepID=A0A396H4H1_MEDTR|nr:hypothetical protein MtrunA17_Chr7g0260691 [Medicago truncatula]